MRAQIEARRAELQAYIAQQTAAYNQIEQQLQLTRRDLDMAVGAEIELGRLLGQAAEPAEPALPAVPPALPGAAIDRPAPVEDIPAPMKWT